MLEPKSEASTHEPSKEVKERTLSSIQTAMDRCIENLVLQQDYRSIVIQLTQGSIITLAEQIGWTFNGPMYWETMLGDFNLSDPKNFSMLVGELARNSHCIYHPELKQKRLDLPYIDSFVDDPNFFSHLKNSYSPSTTYQLGDVQRLAKENCLLLLEEWLHLLQFERNQPVSKKFAGQNSVDWEADVASYLREKGIILDGTIFVHRYHGSRGPS